MSEHLAPDPKPSCCLSSPQGTCEQHATFSEQELRIMDMNARIRRAAYRASWHLENGVQMTQADLGRLLEELGEPCRTFSMNLDEWNNDTRCLLCGVPYASHPRKIT